LEQSHKLKASQVRTATAAAAASAAQATPATPATIGAHQQQQAGNMVLTFFAPKRGTIPTTLQRKKWKKQTESKKKKMENLVKIHENSTDDWVWCCCWYTGVLE